MTRLVDTLDIQSMSRDDIKKQIDAWTIFYLPDMKRLHTALFIVGEIFIERRCRTPSRKLTLGNIDFIAHQFSDTYSPVLKSSIVNNIVIVYATNNGKRYKVAYVTWNQLGNRPERKNQFVRPGNWINKIDILDQDARKQKEYMTKIESQEERDALLKLLSVEIDL